jgi:methyl-accepting chemotaxis protein
MDQVTQQNAALVEEASAAAQSMAQQAQALRDAVEIFKVGDTRPAQAPAVAAPRPLPPRTPKTTPKTSTKTVAKRSAESLPGPGAKRASIPLGATGPATVAAESDWETF